MTPVLALHYFMSLLEPPSSAGACFMSTRGRAIGEYQQELPVTSRLHLVFVGFAAQRYNCGGAHSLCMLAGGLDYQRLALPR